MTNTIENTEIKKKRIKYGFKLEFPSKPFTVATLRSTGAHPSYITAYSRVRKALKSGLIEIVGEKTPKSKRRGRRETIYSRVNAKTAVISTEQPVEAVF